MQECDSTDLMDLFGWICGGIAVLCIVVLIITIGSACWDAVNNGQYTEEEICIYDIVYEGSENKTRPIAWGKGMIVVPYTQYNYSFDLEVRDCDGLARIYNNGDMIKEIHVSSSEHYRFDTETFYEVKNLSIKVFTRS